MTEREQWLINWLRSGAVPDETAYKLAATHIEETGQENEFLRAKLNGTQQFAQQLLRLTEAPPVDANSLRLDEVADALHAAHQERERLREFIGLLRDMVTLGAQDHRRAMRPATPFAGILEARDALKALPVLSLSCDTNGEITATPTGNRSLGYVRWSDIISVLRQVAAMTVPGAKKLFDNICALERVEWRIADDGDGHWDAWESASVTGDWVPARRVLDIALTKGV